MRQVYVLTLISLLFSASALQAQVISDKVRSERLAKLSSVFDSERPHVETLLAGCRDPFYPPALVIASVPGVQAEDLEKMQAQQEHSVVLRLAAERIGASGAMGSGERTYVAGARGVLYKVGDSFSISSGGMAHTVRVDSADSDGYTLSIGEDSLRVLFKGVTQNTGFDAPLSE